MSGGNAEAPYKDKLLEFPSGKNLLKPGFGVVEPFKVPGFHSKRTASKNALSEGVLLVAC